MVVNPYLLTLSQSNPRRNRHQPPCVSSFDVDLETSRQLAHLGASLEGQNSGVVLNVAGYGPGVDQLKAVRAA